MTGRRVWRGLQASVATVSRFNQLELLPVRGTLAGYRRADLAGDVRAGVNVALLAFPQGMAYALIAGLPIQYGIFGSAIAAILGSLFSRNHFIVLGPTNATAVLLMSAFATLGVAGDAKLAILPLIVIASGAFLLLGAYLRLATFIQYISRTVVTGYITAAALLIILNQVKGALGFSFTAGEHADTFFKSLYYTAIHLPDTHLPTLVLSLLSVGCYLILTKYLPKLPNVAITLVAMSLVGIGFDLAGIHDLRLLDPVTASEWRFTPPSLDLGISSEILSAGLAIALLSVLEGTSIGKSLAARAGQRLNTDQEMFNMGMANLGCGLFSGMPASGSLTRSVLNANSGARTPFGSLFSGLIIALGVVTVGSFTQYVPKATLAVVIVCIGISLINPGNIRLVLKATNQDAAVFLVTLATGLTLGLDTAIYAGTGLSIVLFLRQASTPELVEYEFNQQGVLAERQAEVRANPEVSIVHVEGDLFFGASDLFRDQMRRICDDPNLKIVILRMKNARLLDATSVMALLELITYMNENNRVLLVSGVKKNIYRVFRNSGLIERIGRENIFPESVANPTLSTANAIRRAQQIMGGETANVTIYVDPGRNKEKEAPGP